MTAQPVEVDGIDWKRTFPWLRLFRVFHTAIDLRMLLLGCIGLAALVVGDSVFSHLPFAPSNQQAISSVPLDQPAWSVRPLDVPGEFLRDPARQLTAIGSEWRTVLAPVRTIASPVYTLLQADASRSQKAFAWTRLLWALCVWSVIGGAMTRIAAVELARETKVSLTSALRFSCQNFLSYLTAALLPAAGLLLFWILCLIGGLVGRVPYIGPPLLGLAWGLELVFGCMMSLLLIGAAAGWPLMYATISAEASDGFDGFSRAYGYVFSRPWHYLWYALMALAYGAIVITFVYYVASLVAYLSAASVASGMGLERTQSLLLGANGAVGGPVLLSDLPAGRISAGTIFVGVWLQFLALLAAAFAASYFWTSATVMYFLLRQVDDATDFHEVYLPEEKEKDELLPLVGVAASEQPVIERPPQGDFAAGTNVPPETRPPGVRPIPTRAIEGRIDPLVADDSSSFTSPLP